MKLKPKKQLEHLIEHELDTLEMFSELNFKREEIIDILLNSLKLALNLETYAMHYSHKPENKFDLYHERLCKYIKHHEDVKEHKENYFDLP